MTVSRKREAVIRLLRGDDLELVSRELGVTAATLSNWREAFLSGSKYRSFPGSCRLFQPFRMLKCAVRRFFWCRYEE